MVERWIRGLAKARWIVLLIWIALAVVSALFAPNLQTIIRQTEQKFIPSDSESIQAKQLLELIDPSDKAKANALIAFHRDGGITAADDKWLQDIMKKLQDRKTELGIASILSKFDNPDLSSKFVSKDNTTQMVMIGFERADYDALTQESVDKVRDLVGVHPEGAEVNLTGSAPISKDFQQSSADGLKKTEVLTVGLVLVILLVVFRSPIAPFVPLIAIGISFVITRGLVGWATELFGLPVSSFTESFLIAVLFGAGTDYCILIIQRFREELGNGHGPVDALALTMKAVGKTVIFSASTVFFAFFLIGFAKFGLYQSAAGVALGVAVTLLAGLTLAPALLMIFGKIMFWPVKIKHGQGHGESKLWAGMARLSSRKPIAVILVSLLVLSPLILLYQGSRSFDDLAEIDPKRRIPSGGAIVWRRRGFPGGDRAAIVAIDADTRSACRHRIDQPKLDEAWHRTRGAQRHPTARQAIDRPDRAESARQGERRFKRNAGWRGESIQRVGRRRQTSRVRHGRYRQAA